MRLLVFSILSVFSVYVWGGVWNVRDFGARGDGVAKDTQPVQAAVDAAEEAGGGTVEVPRGRYLVGSIFLKDRIDLHLCEGAELVASPNPEDYNAPDVCVQNWRSKVENTSGGHLLLAIEKHDVSVRGPGCVNGNSAAFLLDPKTGDVWPGVHRGIPWRPGQMLYFVECENVRLENLRLEHSPYWSCFLHGCRHVRVRGLDVYTPRKPRTWNGDGLDIDCCQDVRVEDSVFDTDDDCITLRGDPKRLVRQQDCAQVVVTNCVLSSACNAVRLGVGDGVVRDAVFTDLVISNTETAVHLVSGYGLGRGTDIANVRFERLRVDSDILCRIRNGYATGARIGGISFAGISGMTRGKSVIWARSDRPFGTISFDRVDVAGPGVEIASAPDVRFVDSTFAPMSLSPEVSAALVRDVDACRCPLEWTATAEDELRERLRLELAHTIRGGDSYANCWSRRSLWFMYPPVLGFQDRKGAVAYVADVTDAAGDVRTVVSTNATVSLAGIWTRLPKGLVTVGCQPADASGRLAGACERRVFWKAAAFSCAIPQKPKIPFAEASWKAYDYLFSRRSVSYLIEHGEPDPSDPLNAYPSKMLASEISAMVRWAKIDGQRRAAALDCARKAANWLIARSEGEGAPLACFPPTYHGTNLTARINAGLVMLHYPAVVGKSMLELHEATGDERYLRQAKGIAATYGKIQGKDGTWPLKMRLATGDVVAANRLMPSSVIAFLTELSQRTGDAAVQDMADRALGFFRRGPMVDWDWEGQYEDVPPAEMKYDNMTPHFAASLAITLLRKDRSSPENRAFARDVARFCEDQFVCWELPFDGGRRFKAADFARPGDQLNGGRWTHYVQFANWHAPCGLEQYHFYVPIDSAAAKIIDLWLELYRAEANPLDLQKARALGASIVSMMKPDGRIPTSWQEKDGGDPACDWPNCMYYTAGTLSRLAEFDESQDKRSRR